MKAYVKGWLKQLPIPLSKNHRYDIQTRRVIRRVCQPASNCVDIGCYRGEVLESMLRHAPRGLHFAFEPIPELFDNLEKRFGQRCEIHPLALGNATGKTTFQWVRSNPSYSGLRRRAYDRSYEDVEEIKVQSGRLDDMIPSDLPIHFIKVDVEGGEYDVFSGGQRVLRTWRPVVVFECGKGGLDHYGHAPQAIYDLLVGSCNMYISTMFRWLRRADALSRDDFVRHFQEGLNYYFIAYSKSESPDDSK